MALTLSRKPGLADLPDTALDAEKISQGIHLLQILGNTKLGVTRIEFFKGTNKDGDAHLKDGDAVELPLSPVDGYQYSRGELLYLWEWAITGKPEDAVPSAPGSILALSGNVNETTGEVSTTVVYRTTDGVSTTTTNDGALHVFVIGIRGKGDLALAAAPAFTDLADSAFAQDEPQKTSRLKELNRNAKLGVVRQEVFRLTGGSGPDGLFINGDTLPLPTSDVDGYVYSASEVKYVTCWFHTTDANGVASGPGQIRRIRKSVSGARVLTTEVTYREGKSDTLQNDGVVSAFAFCERSIAGLTGTIGFSDLDEAEFFPGKRLEDADAQQTNQNSKFALARPEFFTSSQGDASTVPLPTGQAAYAYVRAELRYLWTIDDSGPPSQPGTIVGLTSFVKNSDGSVKFQQLYTRSSTGGFVGNGSLSVLRFALRTEAVLADEDAPPTEDTFWELIGEGGVNPIRNGGAHIFRPNAIAFPATVGVWISGASGSPVLSQASESPAEVLSGKAFQVAFTSVPANAGLIFSPKIPKNYIKQDDRYVAQIWARVTSGTLNVVLSVRSTGSPFENYSGDKTVTLTTSWQRFIFSFVAASTNDESTDGHRAAIALILPGGAPSFTGTILATGAFIETGQTPSAFDGSIVGADDVDAAFLLPTTFENLSRDFEFANASFWTVTDGASIETANKRGKVQWNGSTGTAGQIRQFLTGNGLSGGTSRFQDGDDATFVVYVFWLSGAKPTNDLTVRIRRSSDGAVLKTINVKPDEATTGRTDTPTVLYVEDLAVGAGALPFFFEARSAEQTNAWYITGFAYYRGRGIGKPLKSADDLAITTPSQNSTGGTVGSGSFSGGGGHASQDLDFL